MSDGGKIGRKTVERQFILKILMKTIDRLLTSVTVVATNEMFEKIGVSLECITKDKGFLIVQSHKCLNSISQLPSLTSFTREEYIECIDNCWQKSMEFLPTLLNTVTDDTRHQPVDIEMLKNVLDMKIKEAMMNSESRKPYILEIERLMPYERIKSEITKETTKGSESLLQKVLKMIKKYFCQLFTRASIFSQSNIVENSIVDNSEILSPSPVQRTTNSLQR
jgi:hypothetical protein